MAGYGTPSVLAAFEKAVEQEVELGKPGKPTKLLGMELEYINGSVKLTQMDSIEKMIQEYGISTLPRHSIPQEGYAQGEEMTNVTKYQSLVGSLLYINRMTRLDISLPVNLLGRRTSKPSLDNLRTAKLLGQYLASTRNQGLIIQPGKGEAKISISADASYGGKNSQSQSGSLVTLYGIPTIWGSQR